MTPWYARVQWAFLIAFVSTLLVAWGARAYLTMAIVGGGNMGVRIALGTLWLFGLIIGHLLPPPPFAIPPPPAHARDTSEEVSR